MLSNARRLLVVDDDQEWVEAITDFLREEGYRVTSVPNGSAALDELSHSDPMVLITDIQMPIMDGRELLERVREQYARLPVIVVSGERTDIGDSGLHGAFRVIHKPVPVEDLLSAIRDAVRHSAPSALQVVPRSQRARFSYHPGRRLRQLVASFRSSAPATQAVFLTLALVASFAFLNSWRTRIN